MSGAFEGDRLAGAAVGICAVVAVGVVVLGGFLPTGGGWPSQLLYAIVLAFPVLGLAIAGLAIYRARTVRSTGLSAFEPPTGDSATDRDVDVVGRAVAERIGSAAGARYDGRQNGAARDVRATLHEGAVRVVQTARGLDESAARAAVRSGRWTDDPVAAAFLAETPSYPLGHSLYAAIDPGAAYRHRVRRTLDAVEAIEADAWHAPNATEGEP